MKGVVLTFRAGDPVPAWFLDVEPRQDVTADMPRRVSAPRFEVDGRVIDEGDRYVVERADGKPSRRTISADLYYCMIVVEKPILWPDGSFWPGGGVPAEADWKPDPERVLRAAKTATDTARLVEAMSRPAEATYYKAAALALGGGVVGLLVGVLLGALL